MGPLTAFVDTSALYALLAADDANHAAATHTFAALVEEELVSHSYVVLESAALVQKRLGMEATRTLLDDLVPSFDVEWVDEALHRAARTALLTAGRRDISLVDWTSFEQMRQRGIPNAFAYDRHFAAQGFELIG